MSDQVSGSLNALLGNRVAKFQREVLQALAWAALGLLVVSVIGFFIIRDITVTLGQVVDIGQPDRHRQPRGTGDIRLAPG